VSNADVQSVPPTLPPEVIVRLFAPADALLIASLFIDTALIEYQSFDVGQLKIMACSAVCNHQRSMAACIVTTCERSLA
jgi:hypothetical protein